MNFTKHIILLISIVVFSCSEQEDILLDKESNDVTMDDISSDEGTEVSYSINFLVESDTRFETNHTISFQNLSENLMVYQWDFGDGSVATEEHSDHSYAEPGKYTVTLTGISGNGESLTYSKDLFVRKDGAQLDILFISYQDSTLNYLELSTNTSTTLYKVPYNPAGVLAYDEGNGKVWYYDYTHNTIIENRLEADNPVILLEDMAGVSDMEFDQTSGELFIALSYDDKVLTYNTADGTTNTTFSSAERGFGKVRDMDLKDGHLYTITPTQSYESVFKVDIAQGNVVQLIDYQNGGYGYGVAYDDLNGKIYFNNVEEAALMRSDPDGSNIEKVIDLDRFGKVSFAGLCLTGLKVVETRNQLLWSSWDEGTLYILDLETLQEAVFEVEGLDGKFVPFENDGATKFAKD